MWRHNEENVNVKDSEKVCENDNDVDSGFLSGSQHTIELSEIRPVTTNKKEINVIAESHHGNIDSGYIEEEHIDKSQIYSDKIDHGLSERLKNLNIKTSINKDSSGRVLSQTEQNSLTGIPNKKEKWEYYYQQNDDGDTQLHWACLTGYVDVVAALIRLTPHPCLLDIQNDDAQTALHIAAFSDQPKIIRMLLIAGADSTLQDRNGNTPLHISCMCGNLQCVKALTEKINVCELKEAQEIYLNRHNKYGAIKSIFNNQFDTMKIMSMSTKTLEIRNYDGERCVHLAAQGSHIDILRQLISCGADINAREGKSGFTALHLAIGQKNENVINFLLDEGLKFNLNLETCTYAGMTAFQYAYMLENPILQKNLEKLGAEIIIPDSDSDLSDNEYNLDNPSSFLSLCVN